MRESHDHSRLKWIRGELDSLLSNASRALEDYAEGSGSADLINSCISNLHQVRGTLQLVQLYGAAMLAEEMELVATVLRDGKVSQPDSAAETLMLGLVHLPGYLEKLEAGARDIPLLILPMLNELRASRDAPLLSEVALFAPELEQKLSSNQIAGEANRDLPGLARRLRMNYHQGLLQWFRETDVDGGLQTIGDVLADLSQGAGTDKLKNLFKVGWAVAEGLRDEGSGKPGVAYKELFGKLDREIKRIIDLGEQRVAEQPANELLKNLLYYAASSKSEHYLINEVREAFGLNQQLFDQDEIDQERAGLQAFDQALIASLRSAIGADLTAIKDGLDLYIRSGSQVPDRLAALEVPLRKVADTLGMIGQGALRERLKRQADLIQGFGGQGSLPDEQGLMAMAGDILFVETSLENLAASHEHGGGPKKAIRSSSLPEGELEKLTDSVMHEAAIEMARNREAIVGFIQSPQTPELLDGVTARFTTVAGALRIMGLAEAGELLQGLTVYINNRLLSGGELPPQEDLNRFADAMTSVEYFMEAVTEGRGVHLDILDIARHALVKLGVVEAPALPEASTEVTPMVAEVSPEVAWVGDFSDHSEPADELLPHEREALAEPEESLNSADKPSLDEVDPEILEIFVEEARDELETIRSFLPRWISDQEDREALITVRRSFHTLKGSGRLVGATAIGELSWAVENLLNRVIDETVSVSPELFELLQHTADVLPELIDTQESGGVSGADIQQMIDSAHVLVSDKVKPAHGNERVVSTEGEGESPEISEPAAIQQFPSGASKAVEPAQADVMADTAKPAIAIDPVLFGIYEPETRSHISNLRAFVDRCREKTGDCDLEGSEISRALHTLHGSADMAGVEPIALLSTALETYVRDLIDASLAADENTLELITHCLECFESVLAAINSPGAELPGWQGLVDEIERRRRNVAELRATASAQAEAAATNGGHDPETSRKELPGVLPVPVDSFEAEEEPIPAAETFSASTELEFDEIEGDEELTEIFLEEARELVDSVQQSLQEWRSNPDNSAPLSDLQRTLHTLKGGARLSGIMATGDLSHAFESMLTEVGQKVKVSAGVLGLAQAVVDRLSEQIDDVGRGPKVRRGNDLITRLESLANGEPEGQATGPAVEKPKQKKPKKKPESVQPSAAVGMGDGALVDSEVGGHQKVASPAAGRERKEQIRVKADLLDKLVNNAGEVSIYRARLEQQNITLGFNLAELEQTVDRLRTQLRSLDIETEAQILFRYDRDEGKNPEEQFDPLEMDRFSNIQQLSRGLLETVNDLTNINEYLDDLHKETETLLLQQSRVATDLQDGLLRTRMVPFAHLVPRLQRVVRQTAAALSKEAELEVQGADGELDRGILDRMIGPLEHILRNAVSHGIESPSRRADANKRKMGRIALTLVREGNDIVLTISDDGAGLNIEAIRSQAIEQGLLDADAEVPDSDVLQFVLEHGFSTQSEVNQISGRGVGLDVVIKEVRHLGGSLDIASNPGKGTSFSIRLPLTLAISDALLVELGEEIYAIPHTSIEGVVRVTKTELVNFYDGRSPFFTYAGNEYRVRYLGALLNVGDLNLSEQRRWYPMLLVRAGEHRVALQVDGLLGNRQIVVKSVGPQVSSIRWISGGTILGDGRVALILDVTALVRIDAAHTTPAHPEPVSSLMTDAGRVVMVVDDSITVRKVTGRVLERNGMKVVTAKDGVDAVAQLQETHPDIMLLDIEMPRMDGFELARHMRNTDELRDIPIIMITSRTGDKHRRLAMELGVKRYLGKPYQEADLLDNIYSVLAEAMV
ncbi:MAG: Hpt domain-containing protein [Gammaproteobacteria bacterium]|nr:Hpt domain-containing protein [Gammaproteobacteria bacterium]